VTKEKLLPIMNNKLSAQSGGVRPPKQKSHPYTTCAGKPAERPQSTTTSPKTHTAPKKVGGGEKQPTSPKHAPPETSSGAKETNL